MLDLIAPRHAHLSTTTQASFDKTSFILSSPCQGLNDRESRVHCFLFTRASSSNRTSLHWPHPLCLTTSSLSRSSLLSIFQYGGYVLFSLSVMRLFPSTQVLVPADMRVLSTPDDSTNAGKLWTAVAKGCQGAESSRSVVFGNFRGVAKKRTFFFQRDFTFGPKPFFFGGGVNGIFHQE